jgi:hypothetical protein
MVKDNGILNTCITLNIAVLGYHTLWSENTNYVAVRVTLHRSKNFKYHVIGSDLRHTNNVTSLELERYP